MTCFERDCVTSLKFQVSISSSGGFIVEIQIPYGWLLSSTTSQNWGVKKRHWAEGHNPFELSLLENRDHVRDKWKYRVDAMHQNWFWESPERGGAVSNLFNLFLLDTLQTSWKAVILLVAICFYFGNKIWEKLAEIWACTVGMFTLFKWSKFYFSVLEIERAQLTNLGVVLAFLERPPWLGVNEGNLGIFRP